MPERFAINVEGVVSDCRVQGEAVTCTTTREPAPDWVDSWSGTFTGKLNGTTMTGTTTAHIEGHSTGDSSCNSMEDYSGPASFVFNPGGTVTGRAGPNDRTTSFSGSCTGSNSGTTPGPTDFSGTWKAIG